MKSELAMISFILPSNMADQNGNFSVKESSKYLSVSTSCKWITGGQNVGNS